jgi:hypothetical protein
LAVIIAASLFGGLPAAACHRRRQCGVKAAKGFGALGQRRTLVHQRLVLTNYRFKIRQFRTSEKTSKMNNF